jgi:hypothetical protein
MKLSQLCCRLFAIQLLSCFLITTSHKVNHTTRLHNHIRNYKHGRRHHGHRDHKSESLRVRRVDRKNTLMKMKQYVGCGGGPLKVAH